ncbi:unnamed protein product [Sphagnum jensenii]|uniref:Uncharacterized protein n=2 Tax=Sphagnum jensenii TaxID=128206 RepID=A0ABP1AI42_9BRYO
MEAGAAAEFGDSRDKFMYFRNAGNEVRQFDQEEDPNGTYVVSIDRRYSESQNGKDEFSYESGAPRRIVGDKSLVGPSLSNQDGQQRRHSGLSDASDGTEILTPTLGRGQDSSGNADGDDYIGRDRRSTGRREWQRRSDIESDFDRDIGPDVRPTGESEMRPASPSYPPEAYQNYRNLPMLNSKKPDDEQFQKLLDVVDTLLNEGREGLEGRIEVGVAERMLYEAADMCAKALTIRPSSLQAIGLWGNTLLLHGELKLRLSQNLRSMVPEPLSQALRRRNSWEAEQEQEGLEQTLQEVCEECEELLVEAGRKFRLALSLDRTDMRALYNWGLALCHRAQLISEEGGERSAQDADRVYLAAIDKFEAMMGMSQKYAPGALLNWGLAIRDRSRLRPLGSKERMKLLAQAKEIFKEALQFDPNYGPARGAVVACTIELKELEEFVDEPIEPPTRERARDRPPRQQQRGWVERQDVENESRPRSWWG